jgi:DNA-directed RNA polymerase specialized sigma subunit
MEVGVWVKCWDGGSILGPVRRQFPSIDHTAPRVVKGYTGTTTTPATTSTKTVSKIESKRMTIRGINRLPRRRRQIRDIVVEG